jgi:hypothetical protein
MMRGASVSGLAAQLCGTALLRVRGISQEQILHGVPQDPALRKSPNLQFQFGSSETPGQLTERLEMGQGGTVHLFIAPKWKAEKRGSGEAGKREAKELRNVEAASVR